MKHSRKNRTTRIPGREGTQIQMQEVCLSGRIREEGRRDFLHPDMAGGRYLQSETGSAGPLGWKGKGPCNSPVLPGLGTKLVAEGRKKERRYYSRAQP